MSNATELTYWLKKDQGVVTVRLSCLQLRHLCTEYALHAAYEFVKSVGYNDLLSC